MSAPFSTPILDSGAGAATVLPDPPWKAQNAAGMQYDGSGHFSNPGGGRGQDYYDVLGPFADSEAYITVTTFNDWSLVGVRSTGNVPSVANCSGYYTQAAAGGPFLLIRQDSNTPTVIGTGSASLANGDKIGIRAIGSSIQGWYFQGGVWAQDLGATAVDATYASGYLAIQQGLTVGRLQDFGGGAITPDNTDATLGMIQPIVHTGRFRR